MQSMWVWASQEYAVSRISEELISWQTSMDVRVIPMSDGQMPGIPGLCLNVFRICFVPLSSGVFRMCHRMMHNDHGTGTFGNPNFMALPLYWRKWQLHIIYEGQVDPRQVLCVLALVWHFLTLTSRYPEFCCLFSLPLYSSLSL